MNDPSSQANETEPPEPANDLVGVTLTGYRALMRSAIDGYADVNDHAMAYGRSLFELLLRPYSLATEAAAGAATLVPVARAVPDGALVAAPPADASVARPEHASDALLSAVTHEALAHNEPRADAGAATPDATVLPESNVQAAAPTSEAVVASEPHTAAVILGAIVPNEPTTAAAEKPPSGKARRKNSKRRG